MHALIIASRLISVLVLTFGLGTGLTLIPKLSHSFVGPLPAFAREDEDEDEEDEEEHEEDEDEDEDRPRTVTTPAAPTPEPVVEAVKKERVAKPKTIIQEIIEERPVVETYVETDPGYDTDGDGDGLVDALDPDPTMPQTAYFTDDDGDSVPNALDTRPGADDILALDELNDSNANGILDTYESL
jgi:hypothetical protein